MADFGIQTFRANGSVAIDSSNKAGVFIESLLLVGNESGGKVYPDIPAGYLYYVLIWSDQPHTIAVGNDSSGQAKISWSASAFATKYDTTRIAVFARRLNTAGSFGANLLNSDGDYLADLNYPVPQYLSTLSPYDLISGSSVLTNYNNGSTGRLEERVYSGSNYGDAGNTLFVMNLPDSTDDDAWYAFNPFSGPYKRNAMYVYHPQGPMPTKLPSIHCFSLKDPVSAGGSFGIQCFSAGGALTYDSSAENISIKGIATLPIIGKDQYGFQNPQSFTVAAPATCGIVAPFYREKWFTDADNENNTVVEYWLSLYQRKGNTFKYMILLAQGTPNSGQFQGKHLYREGSYNGGGVIIADIAQLTPAPIIRVV